MYVINDDEDLIYEIKIDQRDIVDKGDKSSYMIIGLDLVCGKDYVDVNSYGGTMGWLPPEYFVEDIQYEQKVCYFYTESVLDILAEEGYTPIKKLPNIQKPKE